jgi:hypothetical protein
MNCIATINTILVTDTDVRSMNTNKLTQKLLDDRFIFSYIYYNKESLKLHLSSIIFSNSASRNFLNTIMQMFVDI